MAELPLLLARVVMPKGPQPGHRRTGQTLAQPKGSRLLDGIPRAKAVMTGAGVTQGRINTKDKQQDRRRIGHWAARFCWSTQRTSVA